MSYHRGVGMTTDEAIGVVRQAATETGSKPSTVPQPSLPIGLAVVAGAAAIGYFFWFKKRKKRGA